MQEQSIESLRIIQISFPFLNSMIRDGCYDESMNDEKRYNFVRGESDYQVFAMTRLWKYWKFLEFYSYFSPKFVSFYLHEGC